MAPFLSQDEIENLYGASEYFDAYTGGTYLATAAEKLAYYREVRNALEERMAHKGRILDIGSATGHFLSVFKETGWEVAGLELSDWCRTYAEMQFGVQSIKATVESSCFPEEEFDVVSLNHVLEHLRFPVPTLAKMRTWLKDDGILCVEVPNEFNDLIFSIAGSWGRRRLYNMPGPILHHQLFFNERHLRSALTAAGFSVVRMRTSSWSAPVPCHLFSSPTLNSIGKLLRKSVLLAGSLIGKGEFICCLARKIP